MCGDWVIQDQRASGCAPYILDPHRSSPLPQLLNTRSGLPKIRSGLLAVLGDDVVADLLAFDESTHTGALDGADENVLRAIGWLDESKALLDVEEI
jgi:hypothetical protein